MKLFLPAFIAVGLTAVVSPQLAVIPALFIGSLYWVYANEA